MGVKAPWVAGHQSQALRRLGQVPGLEQPLQARDVLGRGRPPVALLVNARAAAAAAAAPGQQVGGTGEGAVGEEEDGAGDAVQQLEGSGEITWVSGWEEPRRAPASAPASASYPARVRVGVQVAVEQRLESRWRRHRLGEAVPPPAAVLQAPVPDRGQRGVAGVRGRVRVERVPPAVHRRVRLAQVLQTEG